MAQNNNTPLPSLPAETWIKILSEHGLSFHDLKRVGGVSREFKSVVESKPLDVHLFRGPAPVATLPEGTQVTLHPVLIAGSSFIENSLEAFEVRDTTYEKSWKIHDLACAQDFATSPPVTTLGLKDFGRYGFSCPTSSKQGVRVRDVLNRIAERWNERPRPDCIANLQMNLFQQLDDASEDAEASEERFRGIVNIKADTYFDLLRDYSDHQFWEGWEGVYVGAKGVAVACPGGFGS